MIASQLSGCLLVLLASYHVTTSLTAAKKGHHDQKQQQQQQADYLVDHSLYRSEASNSSANRRHCDMEVCDSVVTKCTNNRRCSCNFKKSASCAKDCLDCLEEKFGKCCACVDLCPPLKEDPRHSSHVADISRSSDEQLFLTLTTEDDVKGRWTVASGPAVSDIDHPEHGRLTITFDGRKNVLAENDPDDAFGDLSNMLTYHGSSTPTRCVVAFISRQLDMGQCRRYCHAMGASSYRWFHEGCCECVSRHCLHYGIDQPKCRIDF